jgi:hypothetical protein
MYGWKETIWKSASLVVVVWSSVPWSFGVSGSQSVGREAEGMEEEEMPWKLATWNLGIWSQPNQPMQVQQVRCGRWSPASPLDDGILMEGGCSKRGECSTLALGVAVGLPACQVLRPRRVRRDPGNSLQSSSVSRLFAGKSGPDSRCDLNQDPPHLSTCFNVSDEQVTSTFACALTCNTQEVSTTTRHKQTHSVREPPLAISNFPPSAAQRNTTPRHTESTHPIHHLIPT